MNATEKRAEAVRLMKSRAKLNTYTNGGDRKYFFGKPDNVPGNTTQKGWSDCSSAVRKAIQEGGYACELEIDGGAKLTNCAEIVAAGADVIVAGSAVFGGDIAGNVRGFHEKFEEGVKLAQWSK